MLTPRTETERAVFELWKELRPDEAFVLGLDECAGHLFIATQARVESVLAKISRIQKSTQNPIDRKLLASYRASLELREPARLPQTLLESLFGYMIKEGVKANHMRTLAVDGRKALDASRKEPSTRRTRCSSESDAASVGPGPTHAPSEISGTTFRRRPRSRPSDFE